MDACAHSYNVLDELLTLLKLEKIEENIFRGNSQDLGFGNIFGGQVLGQALSAASQTVPPERSAHSMHAYFLRPGDPSLPIVYEVDCIRDGKSFTTRRVVAIQKGRAILSMAASFQVDEPGFEHQKEMPEVPGPDGLLSEIEMARTVADKIPPSIRSQILCVKPIEIRPVNPINPFAPKKKKPFRYVWFKTIHKMPDDLTIHKYMLAYASDFGLVSTSLYPHGRTFWDPDMQVASLDHAMWFHRDFRMDDWLLYAIESPSAGKARGLNHGHIFTRDGKLVASTSQEGLIRYRFVSA
ncbi:MAG: acyl-CoA thioesterase II [Desulfobacterales bacterium]|jgi:acyl-CoA thioesterase-2|nr:acyl-CoA thioesterase II [Desulfobacterales bacterium]